jgi:hypothetical protein
MGVPLSKTKSIDYTRRRRTRRLPDPGSTPGASTDDPPSGRVFFLLVPPDATLVPPTL